MDKKTRLKELLAKLNALQKQGSIGDELSKTTDTLIEEEVANVTAKLQGNPTIKVLQRFSTELAKFKRDFDLKSVIDSIKGLENEITASEKTLTEDFKVKVKDLVNSGDFEKQIESLRKEFISKIPKVDESLRTDLDNFELELQTLLENDIKSDEDIRKELDVLRKDLMSRISNIGGGNMNRQINVNSSVMSTKYTDINFLGNTAIKWTVTDDDTLKRVNIVASITAGGGGSASPLTTKGDVYGYDSANARIPVGTDGTILTADSTQTLGVKWGSAGGSGIVRTTSIISISSTMGAVAKTDYAVFANVGVAVTLPTAVGNTNLYTVKNVTASSSVVVLTTSAQTIDGSATALLQVPNISVDLLSDNANWNVV